MLPEKMKNWDIRPPTEEDLPFILSTWLKSYKLRNWLGIDRKNPIFPGGIKHVIQSLLLQKETEVCVACHQSNPKQIFGYLVYSKRAIHYAYVKEAFRQFGIARSLYEFAGSPKYFTMLTPMAKPVCINHRTQLKYNPFLLFSGDENYGKTN